MFGNKTKLVEELEKQGGQVAWATIVECPDWQTASPYHGKSLFLKVTVRVEPDGGQPFEETVRQEFHLPFPQQGFHCKVIYDPNDHSRIAVIDGSLARVAGQGLVERRAALQALTEKAQAGAAHVVIDGQPAIDSSGALQPAAAAPAALADQLAKLQSLHQQGVLTDDEFQTAKAKLIASM